MAISFLDPIPKGGYVGSPPPPPELIQQASLQYQLGTLLFGLIPDTVYLEMVSDPAGVRAQSARLVPYHHQLSHQL